MGTAAAPATPKAAADVPPTFKKFRRFQNKFSLSISFFLSGGAIGFHV
jgi:hypothetical protein